MLKREISRTNVLIASAGGMIGSGWLFSPFISAQIAGSNALISWVIAAIFMLFIALPLCELGTMFPISGGMTNYPSFTHGQSLGFLFAWTSWLSYVVMTPIEIQAILQYAARLFPSLIVHQTMAFELSGIGYIIAFIAMLLIVLLNSFGIKLLAECNKYASIIKFILPSIAIFGLIAVSPNTNQVQLHLTNPIAWEKIFSALSLGGIAFAFTGFQNGLMLAGEVVNPQRNIPITILGAVLIGFVLYFLLQLSFIMAVPSQYLTHGWHQLSFPNDHAPLVGLTVLVGLSWIAILLSFDAMLSPFGTGLVYTAATARIVYGMALNHHLPPIFTRVNRFGIPSLALYMNFFVGVLSFLPFPSWQKMVAFLSSCSILSYGIGPICLLALRKLQPEQARPFKLPAHQLICHIAFFVCNLMLYWCGFDILWKLDLGLLIGLAINRLYQKTKLRQDWPRLIWFISYMGTLLVISYYGTFGGIHWISFPYDIAILLPFSLFFLIFSQKTTIGQAAHESLATPFLQQE